MLRIKYAVIDHKHLKYLHATQANHNIQMLKTDVKIQLEFSPVKIKKENFTMKFCQGKIVKITHIQL